MPVQMITSQKLFTAYAGLAASGYELTDESDEELLALLEQIRNADFPSNANDFFKAARGNNPINPYWPRGSDISAACLFIHGNDFFDFDEYIAFLNGCGGSVTDELFQQWIRRLPKILIEIEGMREYRSWIVDYENLLNKRRDCYLASCSAATQLIRRFTTGKYAVCFVPNLIQAPQICDYVRKDGTTYVISVKPDIEGILHEFLHPYVAQYRELIRDRLRHTNASMLVGSDKLRKYGYMRDNGADSIEHAVEESIVRALTIFFSYTDDATRKNLIRVQEESGFLLGCVDTNTKMMYNIRYENNRSAI